jgi:hypothetical protein
LGGEFVVVQLQPRFDLRLNCYKLYSLEKVMGAMANKLPREKLVKSNSSFGVRQTRSQTVIVAKSALIKDERQEASEPLYILRYDD